MTANFIGPIIFGVDEQICALAPNIIEPLFSHYKLLSTQEA